MEGVADKKYVFEVAIDSNKIEIRNAVEKIFGVKVVSVNTIRLPGKQKRLGVHIGRTSARKKAIVKLSSDSKTIEVFDSMM